MQKRKIKFLRNFTLLFIFTGISFCSLILGVVFYEFSKQYDKLNLERVNFLHENREERIKNTYNYYLSFIETIEKNRFFIEYLDEESNLIKRENLKILFDAIVSSENQIMQLRYIDENGLEKIRIDRKKLNEDIYHIKDAQLQDKSKRDYFLKAKESKDKSLIVSKIDLNIENGQIQLPINPVWRFSKSIYEYDKFKGVIVINIFANKLLNSIIASDNFDVDLFDQDKKILVSSEKSINNWERYLNLSNPKKEYFFIKKLIDEKNGEILYTGYNPKFSFFEFFLSIKNEIGFLLFTVLLISFILAYFLTRIPIKLFDEAQKHQKILIQQSRLSAMGEMIANIAHQWRQPLNRINLSVNVIKSIFENNSKKIDKEEIELFENKFIQIEKNIYYMSRTISDFSDYLSPNKKREEFYLCALTKRIINIVKDRDKNVNIINEIKTNTKLFGIENEMMQVLLVLLENAIDKFSNCDLSNKQIIISSKESLKNMEIIIQDNGQAISEDIIDKIFDPYFSTKKDSQGTGLGLYMAKMIIEDSFLGNLEVSSSTTATIFKITIPKEINE